MNKNPFSIMAGLMVVGLIAFVVFNAYRKNSQNSSVSPKTKAALVEKNRRLGEELKIMLEAKKEGKGIDEARLDELERELYFGTTR